MHPLITSLQNAKIKNVVALEKARERKRQGVFLIEGIRETTLAIQAGYEMQTIFFCPEILPATELIALVRDESLLVPVQRTVFEKLAYRDSTGGVLAVARQRKHVLSSIKLSQNPLILIIESVEKPGNLGALLRTADAANLDAVIICDPQTDFYNPNVIRSSVGCVFTRQIASATTTETIAWLAEKGITSYCTYLEASQPYHTCDYTKPCAIVMGTESTGLSEEWVKNAGANIIIPMQGKIDSINVSTAAAVVIFEAKRQRNFT
jgi:TrmH family RNA methyltransferase